VVITDHLMRWAQSFIPARICCWLAKMFLPLPQLLLQEPQRGIVFFSVLEKKQEFVMKSVIHHGLK